MQYSFKGKKILVTGGARGIGKDVVTNLVKEGAVVYALSKNPANLKALEEECPEVKTIACDLSDWKATENALADLEAMDHLVNNAGVAKLQLFRNATEEVFDAVFSVNVKAIINVTKIVTNKMIAAGRKGSIVNVASISVFKPAIGVMAYCATKASVDMITKCMSVELAPHNIRVATVYPTLIVTDMSKEIMRYRVETFKEVLPLQECPSPQDCSNAIMFLLSDLAEQTTGTGLMVDSGHSVT